MTHPAIKNRLRCDRLPEITSPAWRAEKARSRQFAAQHRRDDGKIEAASRYSSGKNCHARVNPVLGRRLMLKQPPHRRRDETAANLLYRGRIRGAVWQIYQP